MIVLLNAPRLTVYADRYVHSWIGYGLKSDGYSVTGYANLLTFEVGFGWCIKRPRFELGWEILRK